METFRKDNFSDISEKEDDHESSHSKSPSNRGNRKDMEHKILLNKVKTPS